MKRGKSWMAVGLTAAAVWAVSASLDHAQPAAPAGGTKAGVVDLVRVFNEFEQTKVVGEKMQAETAKMREELDKKMQEIRDGQAELEAFTPDSADWFTRNRKLKEMKVEYEIRGAMEQERIAEEYLQWTKTTYQMVTDEIAAVARKKGFELVVTREEIDMSVMDPKLLPQLKMQILGRKVVYWHGSVDLTEGVLANLNAAFAKAGGAASVKFGR